jgi:uncharacterized Zn finger protein (UPF0148 family)
MFIKEDSAKMAKLLRSGYTMLNLSCPICNNPIFKSKNEELFCPVCNREVVIVENDSKVSKAKNPLKNPEQQRELNNFKINITTNFNELKNSIINKINWLTTLFKDEIQLDQVEKQAKLIQELLDFYEKLTKL